MVCREGNTVTISALAVCQELRTAFLGYHVWNFWEIWLDVAEDRLDMVIPYSFGSCHDGIQNCLFW